MKERLISGSEFWLGAAQGYAFLALGITFVLLSRWMGADRFGTFGTIYSTAVLVGTLLHFSVGHAGLARAGQEGHRPWLAASIRTSELLSIVGIAGGVVSGLVLGALGIVDQWTPAALALGALVPLSMWDYFSIQLLSASGLVGRLNRTLLASRTVMAGGALAGSMAGPYGAAAGLALGLAVNCALTLRALHPVRRDQAAVALLEPLKSGLLLHASALGSILIARGPVLVLAHELGEFEAGQYLLAFQLLSAFLVIPTAASLGVAARIASQGPEGAWRWQVRITTLVATAIGAIAVMAWFSEPLLLPLLGSTNLLAARLFQLLLPALVGWPLAILLGPQWVARGLLWHVAALTLGLAGICLGLSVALVPRWGAEGAAVATSATFVVAFLTNLGLAGYVRRGVRMASRAN